MSGERMSRKTASIVFAIALAVRLVIAFWVHPWLVSHGYQHWGWEWNDGYDALAKNLISGDGYSLDGIHPTALRMPLYPLLLASILKVVGPNTYIPCVFLIQSLLSALTALICYYLGSRLFDRTSGVIAGLIYALHPSAVIYVARCTTEPLFFFIIALSSLLLVEALDRPKAWTLALAGVCFGLSYLVRPVAILIIPFAALFLRLLHDHKGATKLALLAFLVSLVPLAPWTARNIAASKAPVLLSTWGGAPWFHGYHFSDNFFKVKGSRLTLDQSAMKARKELISKNSPELEKLSGIQRELAIDRASYSLVLQQVKKKPLRSIYIFARGLILTWFANYNKATIILGFVLFAALFPAFVWVSLKIICERSSDAAAKFLVSVVLYFNIVHAVIYPHIRYFSGALFAIAVLAAPAYTKILGKIFHAES